MKGHRFRLQVLPPLMVFLVGVVLLESAVRLFQVRAFLVPPPSHVLRTILMDHREVLRGLIETGTAAIVGFALSWVIGCALAILVSLTPWSQRALYPFAVFFQTIPVVGIAPLLVIWLGYGLPAVTASSFLVSVFPMVASTVAGLSSADPALIDLFKLYSAGRFQTLFALRLPSALPYMMTGMRVTAGLAVIGAVVGEFIAGGGLGTVIDAARTQQRTDKVFAAVLLVCLLGLAMLGGVNLLSLILLRRWRHTDG